MAAVGLVTLFVLSPSRLASHSLSSILASPVSSLVPSTRSRPCSPVCASIFAKLLSSLKYSSGSVLLAAA
eukprot:3980666-Pleurochrysis_carterae.AAC.2